MSLAYCNWFTALICFLCLFGTVIAQAQCVSVELVSRYVKLCQPYLSSQNESLVYLPPAPTKWFGQAFVFSAMKRNTKRILWQPPDCQRHLLSLTCATGFPSCRVVPSQGSESRDPPLLHFRVPCASFCRRVVEVCQQAGAPPLPLNCSSFPEEECRTLNEKRDLPPRGHEPTFPPAWCGGVLAYDSSTQRCALKCPPPGFISDPTRHAVDWTIWLAVPPVLLFLLIMTIVQVSSQNQREYWWGFPQLYIWICNVVIVLALTGFLIAGIRGGLARHACHTDTRPIEGDDVGCTLQAWILYCAAWGQLSTFAIISFNVFLLFFRVPLPTGRLFRMKCVYFALILIPPLVVLPVTQATGNLGYAGGGTSTICLFRDVTLDAFPDLPNALTFFALVLPFTVSIGLGYTLLLIIVLVVCLRPPTSWLFGMHPIIYPAPTPVSNFSDSGSLSLSSDSQSIIRVATPRGPSLLPSSPSLADCAFPTKSSSNDVTNITAKIVPIESPRNGDVSENDDQNVTSWWTSLGQRLLPLQRQWRVFAFVLLYGTSLLMALLVFWSAILDHAQVSQAAEIYYSCRIRQWMSSLIDLRDPAHPDDLISPEELPCDDSGLRPVGPFLQWWTLGFIGVMMALLLLVFFAPQCWRRHQLTHQNQPLSSHHSSTSSSSSSSSSRMHSPRYSK